MKEPAHLLPRFLPNHLPTQHIALWGTPIQNLRTCFRTRCMRFCPLHRFPRSLEHRLATSPKRANRDKGPPSKILEGGALTSCQRDGRRLFFLPRFRQGPEENGRSFRPSSCGFFRGLPSAGRILSPKVALPRTWPAAAARAESLVSPFPGSGGCRNLIHI